jgi:hypothetical protein
MSIATGMRWPSAVRHGDIFEAACFHGIEAMLGTDAIRLTLLLQKTTLDPSL